MKRSVIERVGMGRLLGHPLNANVMTGEGMRKLRRHLEKGGRYEPLVVRRHPGRAGFFELINGHHRKLVLEEMGEKEVDCVVWELTDAEALMVLATINRLGGEDAAGKRLELLEGLEGTVEELAKLLPEGEEVLRGVLGREAPMVAEAPALGEMMEALTVFLTHEEKGRVVRALREVDGDLGRALVRVLRAED